MEDNNIPFDLINFDKNETTTMTFRVPVELEREYLAISGKLGTNKNKVGLHVLQNPWLKIQFDIEELIEENARMKKIIDKYENELVETTREFREAIQSILDDI